MNLDQLAQDLAPLNLRSALISHAGSLVFEHYRDQSAATELYRINSCTKSILSALICIAMDQGLLPPQTAKAAGYFPQLRQDADSRKQDMTLEHLLTMSAGFNWSEFGGINSFPKMTRTGNWIDYVLQQPLREAPGTRMEYNSGVSQLLSAILVQVSGMSAARFAELYLFGPLGIQEYLWQTDPQGIHTGGFGLSLRPADLLAFGELYLRKGKAADGAQLISPELIARSTAAAIGTEPPRSGRYGWHWRSDSYTAEQALAGAAALEYYYARGYGGQFVYIVPEHETVVVLTSDQRMPRKQAPPDVFRSCIAPRLLFCP
ncbi:serine hydrolase domain-containing protein [Paenibacillus tengchongensis]|uniref:serine hydrolase domain-containing protein n=1 Tax=Paenibacillus tengchongensis TaxID=2608684 RepID=UPI00124D81C2|nr:serine hydrolase [Paenibacillus tengchongensis]